MIAINIDVVINKKDKWHNLSMYLKQNDNSKQQKQQGRHHLNVLVFYY